MPTANINTWLTNPTLVLRVPIVAVLIMHSIPGMFDGGVNAFGNFYLNEIGFAPVGVPLAWAIKLSHVVCAVLLLLNRYIIIAGIVTISILLTGIFILHLKEGWYVVGAGRNGVEFNVILISVLVYLMIVNRKK